MGISIIMDNCNCSINYDRLYAQVFTNVTTINKIGYVVLFVFLMLFSLYQFSGKYPNPFIDRFMDLLSIVLGFWVGYTILALLIY